MDYERNRLATLLAHLGDEDPPSATSPLVPPIYQSSVWRFRALELLDHVQDGQAPGYIYSRMGNPSVARLEQAVAALEGAGAGLALASGMAVITATLMALTRPGQRVVAARELYGGTTGLLALLANFGVEVAPVNLEDRHEVEQALSRPAAMVLVETLANPRLAVADLPFVANRARDAGAWLVVDNTFATPYLCRPLAFGADLVVHSLTKFLSGHGDVTAGVCVGSPQLIARLRPVATVLGAALDPFAAWLAVRGMKTLALRMERACANALTLARFLEGHPRVQAVHYPGLPGHAGHALAEQLLGGRFGAMLAFELSGGEEAVATFVKAARLVRLVPSLGDVATTISHPAKTSHRGLSQHAREEAGIGPGLLRVSVGIESAGDLVEDFRLALEATP
ncbi:MAG: aminotransferase class I/II-fold pyridoxal phosphate-dependent enzyme [Bacillota bacterium]